MISMQQLLQEMARQLKHAEQAQNEAERLAAITAVQALCNVALARDEAQPAMQQLAAVTPATVMQRASVPIIEEDANGNSLFDF